MNPSLNRRNLLVGTALSTVTLALAPTAEANAASSCFVDVPSNHPFACEINWMRSAGITTGWQTSRGREFRPSACVSRDSMAAFLYRCAGCPQFNVPASSPFRDVSPNTKFYKEICWFQAQGISTGWQTSRGCEFRPTAPVARDAMAAFLYRCAGSPEFTPPATSPFRDVTPKTKFYKEICWFQAQGISTGWKTSRGCEFRPTAPVARDAMAAFLCRFRKACSSPCPVPAPSNPPAPAPTPAPKEPIEKPSEPTTGTYHQQVAAEILKLVNSERAKAGLGSVERHSALEKIAQEWSNVMARENRLYHNPNFSQQYPRGWRGASENIAQHFYDTNPRSMAAKLMQSWMGSSGHRANILAQGTNRLGFGIATTSDGKVYACQNFAQY